MQRNTTTPATPTDRYNRGIMGPTDTTADATPNTPRMCAECKGPIGPHKNKNTLYCKPACAQARQVREWQAANQNRSGVPLDTNTVSELSKMLVATHLVNKGYEVFKALTKRSCDFAVAVGGRLLRIDVCTGYYTTTGALQYPKGDPSPDVYAVVVNRGEVITFEPSLETFMSTEPAQ